LARIGLLSDSHGRARTTRRGVDVLLEQSPDVLIHLGDIGTMEVIDTLAVNQPGSDEQIQAHLVFGNTDWDTEALARYAESLGIIIDDPMGELDTEQGKLCFTHGHREDLMQMAAEQGARYLCHGHTHRSVDQSEGRTRIINPGALFRARSYSVALLDTAEDKLEFFTVPER